MNTADTVPPLLLLAGTSEAGKSTAGEHLASCGAARVKIRPILLALTTGRIVHHEGIPTREGFDPNEFINTLGTVAACVEQPLVVIESFIDPSLACRTRTAWPARCQLVFVTADDTQRIARHAAANRLPTAESAALIARKDTRKQVFEQLDTWRLTADHWIDNSGPISNFHTTLEQVMASTLLTNARSNR